MMKQIVTIPRDRKLNPLPFYNLSFRSRQARKAWQDRFLNIYNRYDNVDDKSVSGEVNQSDRTDGANLSLSTQIRYQSTIPLDKSSLYLPEARNWNNLKHMIGNAGFVDYFAKNQGDGGRYRVVKVSMAKLFWRDFREFLYKFILEQGGYSRGLLDGADAVQRWRYGSDDETWSGTGEGLIWLVKFRAGFEHEAQRLARDWDMKWVRLETSSGHEQWTRLQAEVLW